uniref:Thioredoxin n=1 Tax=Sus scrofa TaxID=9823 RepID=A0A8D1TS40_PIG
MKGLKGGKEGRQPSRKSRENEAGAHTQRDFLVIVTQHLWGSRNWGCDGLATLLRNPERAWERRMMTTLAPTQYAFQEALNSAGEKLVVVDFSATWCGPCKMIKPFFHSLSEKYSNVVFLEVDVDDCQDVASECEVKCMPTFQFFKKGQKVGEFSGANKEKLEATINELI